MTVSILVTYDIQSATGQLSSGAATNQIKAGNTLLNFASGSPLVQNFPTVNSLGPLSNDGAGNLSYTVLTASKLYGCNQSGMLSPINVGTNLSLVGSTLSAAGGSGSIQLTGDVTSPLSSGTVPTTFGDITAYSVLANSTGSSGAPTAFAVADTTLLGGEDGTGALINVTLGANLSMVSGVLSAAGASGAVTLTGAVTGTGTGSVATVFGNIGANTVLANATAGSAAPTPIALTASQLLGRGSTGNIAAIVPDNLTCQISGNQLQVLGAPATGTAGGNLSGTYPNPFVIALKTASGSVTLGSATAPTAGQILTAINSTSASWQTPSLPGTGTVTSVSVTSANGVSGTVATATTTPAITLSLAAITPTSVNGVVLGGASTPSLTVTGTSSISGSNTGDQFTNLAANSVLANNTVSAALPVGIALGASTFIGRGSTGNVASLAPDGTTCAIVGSQLQVLGAPPIGTIASGDLQGSSYPNPVIAANKVTYAKLQQASAGNVVLANPTASAASYQEVTLAASRLLGRGSTGNIAAIAPDNLTCQIVGTTLSVIKAIPTGTAGGDLVGTYPNPNVIGLSNTSTSVAIGGAAAPSAGQVLTAINSTSAQWQTPSTPGTGTVTSVSVTTANGVSGTVATATTTPAITLSLGAITPSSVNSIVLSGSSTPSLTVTGTASISGVNTGDQFTALSPNSVLANNTTSAGLPGAVVLANSQLLGRGLSGNNIGAIALASGLTMGGGSTLTVTGAPPTGTIASGDLQGSSYPNPVIAANKVTYAKIQQSNAGNAVMCNATSGIGNFGEVDLPNFQQLLGRGQSGNLAAISLGTGLFMTLNTLNVAGDSLMQPTVIGSTFGYEDNANHNTGIGYQVFNSLTSGQFNVAMGDTACKKITNGSDNMAVGYAALSQETTGIHNTALGSGALLDQNGASNNTAIGSQSLNGTIGSRNTGIGYAAGRPQGSGTDNTYIGYQAGTGMGGGSSNTFIGSGTNTTNGGGANQIAIGFNAQCTVDNQIAFSDNITGLKSIHLFDIKTEVLDPGITHNYYVIQDSSGNWGTTPYASASAQMQPTVLGTAYGYIDNSLSNYAVGYQCLGNSHALTGTFNTSLGTTTLISLTTGAQNTCAGYGSMYEETTGTANSVFGTASLSSSHGNTYNTAMGAYILTAGTGCSANSAVGFQALQHTQSNNNVAIGANAGQALTSGSNCTFLGEGTDTSVSTASNQIAIGSGAVSTAAGQIAFPLASTHILANGITDIKTQVLNTSVTPDRIVVQDSSGNWGASTGGGVGFSQVLYTNSSGTSCSNTLTTLDSFTVPANTFSVFGDALLISAQFSASTSASNEEADCFLFINSSNFSDSTAAVQDFGGLEPFYIVMEATLTYTVSGWLLISGIYTKCLMHPSSTSGAVTLVASGFNFWTAFNKTSAFTINFRGETLTSNGSITSQGVSIILAS